MDVSYSTPATSRMGHGSVGKEYANEWVGGPVEDSHIRALAVGALFARTWSGSHDALSYAATSQGKDEEKRNKVIAGLHDWWGVTSADEALNTARRLHAGMHAPSYELVDPLARDCAKADEGLEFLTKRDKHREFLSTAAQFSGRDPAALLHTYDQWTQALRLHRPTSPFPIPVSLAGWDLVRSVFIIRGAHTAGYLDEDTAWTALNTGLRIAQSRFQSWRQLGDSYLVGYSIWQAEKDLASMTEAVKYRTVQTLALHLLPCSPWRRVALHPGGEVDIP